MKISKPYTYLIGWSKIKKYYYGVRYKIGCQPDDLWKKYFTSSYFVKCMRETFGEPDIIQIRKVFDDIDKARTWEMKVLRRMKVLQKEEWLNKTDNISIDPFCAGKANRGKEAWNKGQLNLKAKGTKFYNNGEIQKMFIPGIEPQGWFPGRLNKPWNTGLTIEDERVLNNLKSGNFLKSKPSKFKNISYEERFGKEKASELKENLRNLYKGKTYEELHGEEKAREIRQKQSDALGKNKKKAK